MGVGRKFARGRCDGRIAAVEEEGSMEGEGASSVESWRDDGGGAECGYEQQHPRSRSDSSAMRVAEVLDGGWMDGWMEKEECNGRW